MKIVNRLIVLITFIVCLSYQASIGQCTVTASSSSTTICNGQVGVYTMAAASQYEWYYNGSLLSTNAVSGINAVAAGSYYVRANVSGCGWVTSNTIYISDSRPAPVSFRNISSTSCVNAGGQGYYVDMTPYTYNWSLSSGGTIDSQSTGAILATWSTTGSKTVSVSVTNSSGCQSITTSLPVTVINPPTATFTGTLPPSSVCNGSAGNIYTTQGGMTEYYWSCSGCTFTSGGNSGDNSASVKWNAIGDQTVSVSYRSSVCQSTTASATVHVLGVNPTLTNNNTSICVGGTQLFTTESGMNNYTWNIPGSATLLSGGTSTSNTATLKWNTPGPQSVSVSYVTPGGCATAPVTSNVTVGTPPSAITGVQGLMVNFENEATRLQVTGASDATSFTWSPSGSFQNTGTGVPGREVLFTPSSAGLKTLTVQAISNGCQGSVLTVSPQFNVRPESEKSPRATIPQPHVGDEKFIFLDKHSSHHNGCIENYGPVSFRLKADFGDTYNLGERPFTVTVNARVTAYYDLPALSQTWDVSFKLVPGAPEQLYTKDLAVNPQQLKFIGILVTGSTSTDAVAANYVRLVGDFSEDEDRVSASSASVTLTPLVADNTRWEQTFQWSSSCPDVTNYEFQLLRIYGEQGHEEEKDWNNALTLYTENGATSLTVSMAEGGDNTAQGSHYYWRVRAIGNLPGGVGNAANLTNTAWSELDFVYKHPEDNANWIYSRTFTEGGRVSEKVVYANGLQQIAQQQTRIQDVNQVVASQTLQDYAGRNAVTSLPIPVSGKNNLGYIDGLLKNGAKSFGTGDFDGEGTVTAPSAATDLGGYYSGEDQGSNSGVASAEGYPYSRTVFTNDGTSRVSEQSGVGKTHSLAVPAADHKTMRTFYSNPLDGELVQLFGKEAPDVKSVQKILTYDANGTGSATYKTKDGKVIATALVVSGNPSPLTPLASQAAATKTMIEEVKMNVREDAYAAVARKPLLFAAETSLTVDYEITPAQLRELCPPTVNTTGLVGYYPFEGNANDASTRNNNATAYATLTTDPFGGQAYLLDGGTNYLEVGDSPDLDFGAEDFTVSFWVRKTGNTPGNLENTPGVNKWNNGNVKGSNEWALNLSSGPNSNKPVFYIESGLTTYFVGSPNNLTLGAWTHLVGVRRGTAISLYVNGVPQGSATVGSAIINNVGRPLQIGKMGAGLNTAGSFDDVAIYRRGLSDVEVKQLYQRSGPLCKTCDYKIEFFLHKDDDPAYVHPGLPPAQLIRAGECAEQTSLKLDLAPFTLTGLSPGVNYQLEKRITTNNVDPTTVNAGVTPDPSKTYLQEHEQQLRTYYQGQADNTLILKNVNCYLSGTVPDLLTGQCGTVVTQPDLLALKNYLEGLRAANTISFDADNQQYIIPVGTGAEGCPEYVFIPVISLCNTSPNCTSNGTAYEAYFESLMAAAHPEVVLHNTIGSIVYLNYAYFKNRSTGTTQYFQKGQLDAMLVNLVSDNSGRVNCNMVWEVLAAEAETFAARGSIDFSNTTADDLAIIGQNSVPAAGENNLVDNVLHSLEAKLQGLMTEGNDPVVDILNPTSVNNSIVDICAQATNPFYIKKTELYGTIGGGQTANAAAPDLTHAYKLVFFDENVQTMADALRYYAVLPQGAALTLSTFQGLTLCNQYKLFQQTQYGNLQVQDAATESAKTIVKMRKVCAAGCETRAEEFRQAIVHDIFMKNAAAHIEHYSVRKNMWGTSWVATRDVTVNTISFDYSECELDAMVDALVQNCIDNYCNTPLTATTDPATGFTIYGTAAEREKLVKAMLYKFELTVNQPGQTCAAGWDYLDQNTIAGSTPPDSEDPIDPTSNFPFGELYGPPSNPANFDYTFTVTNTLTGYETGSLLWALHQARLATPEAKKLINFNIPGPGQHLISLSASGTSAFNLTIDGTTQPSFSKTPLIVIESLSSTPVLFFSPAYNIVVTGLEFKGHSFYCTNCNGIQFIGNICTEETLKMALFKRTDGAGTIPNRIQGNIIKRLGSYPVLGFVQSDLNDMMIGGPLPAQGNLIEGDLLLFSQGAYEILNNTIENNIFYNVENSAAIQIGPPRIGHQGNRISKNITLKGNNYAPAMWPIVTPFRTYARITGVAKGTGDSFTVTGVIDTYPPTNSDLRGEVEVFITDVNNDLVKFLGSAIVKEDLTFQLSIQNVSYGTQLTAVHIGLDNNTSHNRNVFTIANCTSVNHTLCFRFTDAPTSPTIPDNMLDLVYEPTTMSCEKASAQAIKTSLANQVEQLIDRRITSFRELYKDCAEPSRINDKMVLSYNTGLHHFTLYYYDRAGNLMRTVPPKGVALLAVNTGTALDVAKTVYPAHTLVTEYQYNSLGQLVRQHSPDANPAATVRPVSASNEDQFNASDYFATSIYNDKGQIRFSRNAKQKQAAEHSYAYTKYDNLGRITEVGEADNFDDATLKAMRNQNSSFPMAGTRHITATYYTDGYDPEKLPAGYTQENLRNRVSYAMSDEDGDLTSITDQATTVYSYDPHGNVNWIVQIIPGMGMPVAIRYQYDLISGKVTQVQYNPGEPDQFYHKYDYDADNCITAVSTSRDGYLWEKDATYSYYLHGPLKRTVIGEDQLQGIDYTYTIQGWLKALNHPQLDKTSDPLKDGNTGSIVGRDAFGMALTYFSGDYRRAGSTLDVGANPLPAISGKDLYNGNISAWASNNYYTGSINTAYANANLNYKASATGYKFQYDELNRLLQSDFHYIKTGTWTAAGTAYGNTNTYDANGNITSVVTYDATALLDNIPTTAPMVYYAKTNQLSHVPDQVAPTAFGQDVERQTAGNYLYDLTGNLIRDEKQKNSIFWSPYGKVLKVANDGGTYTKFQYDASGNRVSKKRTNSAGLATTTYYVRDASGNTMGVYERTEGGTTNELTLLELPIYGSDRIGQYDKTITVPTQPQESLQSGEVRIDANVTKVSYEGINYLVNSGTTLTLGTGFTNVAGDGTATPMSVRISKLGGVPSSGDGMHVRALASRRYELKDHLGNVRAIISDAKLSVISGGTASAFEPKVVSVANYYPFGMDQPGRMWNADEKYRYGFNGKEKDDNGEWGSANYDYGFRVYNPSIGKFLSVDPLTKSYPMLTPYQFASNTPIAAIDLDGLELAIVIMSKWYERQIGIALINGDYKKVMRLAQKAMLDPAKDGFALKMYDGKFAAFPIIDGKLPTGISIVSSSGEILHSGYIVGTRSSNPEYPTRNRAEFEFNIGYGLISGEKLDIIGQHWDATTTAYRTIWGVNYTSDPQGKDNTTLTTLLDDQYNVKFSAGVGLVSGEASFQSTNGKTTKMELNGDFAIFNGTYNLMSGEASGGYKYFGLTKGFGPIVIDIEIKTDGVGFIPWQDWTKVQQDHTRYHIPQKINPRRR